MRQRPFKMGDDFLAEENMLELNSRMAYILNATVKEKGRVPISSILDDLKISKRTFYFELKKTNDWLKLNELGSIQISGQQLIVEPKNSGKLRSRLGEMKGYLFSVEERRKMEIFFIALSYHAVTIDKMQSFFDVSKNTILNDIGDLKKTLLRYDIKICSSAKKGYHFVGEEFSIRRVISKEILTMTNRVPQETLQELLQDSMDSITHSNVDYRLLIRGIIHDYENLLQTQLVQSDIQNVITMIVVAYIRSSRKFELNMDIQEKQAIAETREYQTVQLLVRKLHEEHLTLSVNETFYITILFLGIKNFDFQTRVSEKNFIMQTTESIIENFMQITGLTFQNKDVLYSRLYLHIKPMYYRLKYGIHISNPILEKIRTMYPDILEYTREAVQKTGGEIASLITEDEIAYLCIYMASFLKEYHGEKFDKKKILIVCGAGVSTSVLIREQLLDFLGDLFSYQLSPAGELKEDELADYLLVISTVMLDLEAKNIIYTGPILDEKTKMQIVRFLMNCNCFSGNHVTIHDVIQAMKEENIAFNESEMFLKLLQLYQQNHND